MGWPRNLYFIMINWNECGKDLSGSLFAYLEERDSYGSSCCQNIGLFILILVD